MAVANGNGWGENSLPDDLDVLEQKLNDDPSLLWGEGELLVRRSLRVPCLDRSAAGVRINGKPFELINIGSRGLGVMLPEGVSFFVDEDLPDIEFSVQGQVFMLRGEVAHVTETGSGHFCCGIRLLDLSSEQEKAIRCLLLAQQAAMASAADDQAD